MRRRTVRNKVCRQRGAARNLAGVRRLSGCTGKSGSVGRGGGDGLFVQSFPLHFFDRVFVPVCLHLLAVYPPGEPLDAGVE